MSTLLAYRHFGSICGYRYQATHCDKYCIIIPADVCILYLNINCICLCQIVPRHSLIDCISCSSEKKSYSFDNDRYGKICLSLWYWNGILETIINIRNGEENQWWKIRRLTEGINGENKCVCIFDWMPWGMCKILTQPDLLKYK